MSEELLKVGSISPAALNSACIQNLFQFFRQTDFHKSDNKIFENCAQELMRVIDQMIGLPGQKGLQIEFKWSKIFINKKIVLPKARQFKNYRYLIQFAKKREIGSIKFNTIPKLSRLMDFLWILVHIESEKEPIENALNWLRSQDYHEFEITVAAGEKGSDASAFTREQEIELIVKALYKKLHRFVEVCWENREGAEKFKLEAIQQLIADSANLADEDLTQILRLVSMKRYERPMPYLAVNVFFLVLAWAKSLQLPSGVIQELGAATLAHIWALADDLKPRDGNPENLFVHLQKTQTIWPLGSLQRLAVLEWNQSHDNHGVYMMNGVRCYAHFFSRMIRVASTFEQLTTFSSGKKNFLPDEALAELLVRSDLDSTLVKLFVNWMGVYPIGSYVLLQTGEVAQVFAGASDPTKFKRPIVRLIKDASGNAVLGSLKIVDLSEVNERLGTYKRSIKKSLSPEEAGISVGSFEATR